MNKDEARDLICKARDKLANAELVVEAVRVVLETAEVDEKRAETALTSARIKVVNGMREAGYSLREISEVTGWATSTVRNARMFSQ